MKYLLSDGTETSSKYDYINDAVKFALSIDSYSIPNSKLGLHISNNNISSKDKLAMNTLIKNIDPSLTVDSLTVDGEDIILILKYPYGEIKAVL